MSDKIEYKDWTIEIIQDDCDDYDDSPRKWDNIGFMACWHRRMWLGDDAKNVQKYTPSEWIMHTMYEDNMECWTNDDTPDDKIWKLFEKHYIWLPVNAYEHGGITISTGSRAGWDSFDSGQLGIIYVSKEKALKEFSQKKWSKKLEDKIISILEGEVETYDQYLQGDVWGYNIYRPEDEDCDDSVASCWGFYGTEYVIEEAKRMVDWNIENDEKQEKLLNSCMSQ